MGTEECRKESHPRRSSRARLTLLTDMRFQCCFWLILRAALCSYVSMWFGTVPDEHLVDDSFPKRFVPRTFGPSRPPRIPSLFADADPGTPLKMVDSVPQPVVAVRAWPQNCTWSSTSPRVHMCRLLLYPSRST